MIDPSAFSVDNLKPGFSMSRLKTFAQCAYRFAMLYIAGHKEPPSDAMKKGSIVHEITAEYRRMWLSSGADLKFGDHLANVAEKAGKSDDIQASDDLIQEAYEMATHAINHMPNMKPDKKRIAGAGRAWWVESRLAFDRSWRHIEFQPQDVRWWGTAEQRKKTWFRMIADFAYVDVDGWLTVEDDKTGWAKHDHKQVLAYGYGFSRLVPKILGVRCSFNLLNKCATEDLEPAAIEDLGVFPDWFDARAAEIMGTTEWTPTICEACRFCSLVDTCPAHAQVAQQVVSVKAESIPEIQSLEQAQRAALWLWSAEVLVSVAKEKLKAWVGEHGSLAVPGTDSELRFNPSTSKDPKDNLEAWAELFKAFGSEVPVLDQVKPRWSDVENLIKKRFPLGGKGVTKELKEANREQQALYRTQLSDLYEEKPRAATFGIFKVRD